MPQASRTLLIVAALAVTACSSAPPTLPDTVQPGAQGWQGAALMLPAGTPVVMRINVGRMLAGVRELLEWASEPALYANEVAPVQPALLAFESLTGGAGGEAWARHGIDTTVPIVVGIAPLPSSLAYQNIVENALVERFGVNAVASRLERAQASPGLHSEIAQRAKKPPLFAMRALVPASDPDMALAYITSNVGSFGFEAVSPQEMKAAAVELTCKPYLHPELDFGVCIRQVKDKVVVDTAFGLVGNEVTPAYRLQVLQELAVWDASKTGRPSAPKASWDADVELNVDAASVAAMSRVWGYQLAMAESAQEAAANRDDYLIETLNDTLTSAQAWEIQSEELPGFSYALSAGDPSTDEAFTVELAYSIAAKQPKLNVQPSSVGIGTSQRALVAAFSASALREPEWKSLTTIEEPTRLLEILDVDASPWLYGPALPRLGLIVMHNLIAAGPNALNPLSSLMPSIQTYNRIEVAWLGGVDQTDPKLLLFSSVQPSSTNADRLLAATHLVEFGSALTGIEPAGPFELGPAVQPVPLSGTPGFCVMNGDSIVVGIGVERDAFMVELQGIKNVTSTNDIVFVRGEPATWVPMLAQAFPALNMFDLPILAQRLGPFTFRAFPDDKDGTQFLRWRIEWKRPARL